MPGTVIFDAFGTLLRITDGVHPYRQILKEGIRNGRRPKPDDAHTLMTKSLGLKEAADHFGIPISQDRMAELQDALDRELRDIEGLRRRPTSSSASTGSRGACSRVFESVGPVR